MTEGEQLLTLTEAADELGMSRQRLALLAKQGRLGRQVTRYWVFTASELEQYKPLVKASKGGRPKSLEDLTMKYGTPRQEAA